MSANKLKLVEQPDKESVEEQLLIALEPLIDELGLIKQEIKSVSETIIDGLKSDNDFIDSLKGKDAPAITVEMIVDHIKSRQDFIELVKSKDIDVNEVIEKLIDNENLITKLKGEEGKAGKSGEDGQDADPAIVAAHLQSDPYFINKVQPKVDINQVAEQLSNNYTFIEKIKGGKGDIGENGKDGVDADPKTVAESLKKDQQFIDSVKAKDVDPIVIAEILQKDKEFVESVKGDIGERGKDGADADNQTIAELLQKSQQFIESVKSKEIDIDEVVEKLHSNQDFVKKTKGEEGKAGKSGEDGQDADPAIVAAHLQSDPYFINKVQPKINVDELVVKLNNDFGFIEKIKGSKGESGKNGEDGKDSDPKTVAELLKKSEQFIESLKGKDADIDQIVEKLNNDYGFIDKIKGEDGADAKSVALELKNDPNFIQKLKVSKVDIDLSELAGLIVSDPGFVDKTKGEVGGKGLDGADGKDADPAIVAGHLSSDPYFINKVKPVVDVDEIAKKLSNDVSFIGMTIGKPGENGKDGKDADNLLIAEHLKNDPKFYNNIHGKDSDPAEVAKLIKNDNQFIESLKAKEIDPSAVAEILKADGGFSQSVKGADGKDGEHGKDSDPLAVAEILKSNPVFIESLKAKEIDPSAVAEILKADGGFSQSVKGADGKDADPIAVAKYLNDNPEFLEKLKGDKGEKGAVGDNGADADPSVVAAHLNSDPYFINKVRGKDADVDEIVEKLNNHYQFIKKVTGKPGENCTDADNLLIAEHLRNDPSFYNNIRGKDADIDEVVSKLNSDPRFLEKITGKDGIDGKDGKDGKDGISIKGDTGEGLFTETWEPGIYRQDVIVSHYFGQYFKALGDTSDEPGTSEKWERIGKFGFRFAGPYREDKEYAEGDLYVKDYGLFLYANGKANIVAGRGQKGDRGERGLVGFDGKDGKDGSEIDVIELKDTNLVFLFKNGDEHEVKHVDLSPILEPYIKILHGFEKDLEKSLKQTIEQTILAKTFIHKDDRNAIPVMFFRGEWSSDKKYYVGDMVSYSGGVYVVSIENSGEPPIKAILKGAQESSWQTMIAGIAGESAEKLLPQS